MADRPAALLPTPGPDFAEALAAKPLPNLRHIGDEMFAWSDDDPQRGPALPRGAVVRFLLTQLAGPRRSVLIAGPHADDLVAAVVGTGATVTWLLRSRDDAARAANTHPTTTVLCGAVGHLSNDARFDVVVAADGVDRLNSAEGGQLSFTQILRRLTDVLRPDGAVLFVHDNPLGVHHTVRLESGARQAADAAWYPVNEQDPRRPASLKQLVTAVADDGLQLEAAYAVFPDSSAPTLLLGHQLLGDLSSPLRPQIATALSQAFSAAFRGRPVLSDPRVLMTRALRAGAEGALAAAWMVVVRRCDDTQLTPGRQHGVLIGDVHGTFAYELSMEGSQQRTTVLQPWQGPAERAGLRRITTDTLAPCAEPAYVWEERLWELCASHDLRALRAELGSFDAWLAGLAHDGAISGPAALVGPGDVLVTGAGLALAAARWEPVMPVPHETVVVRALWQLAVHLVTSRQPHPWPLTSTAVDLTAVMLGMLGRRLTERDVRAAVDVQVAWETAEYGLSLSEQHDRTLQLLSVAPGTPPVDVAGYRELAEALWRQRYQASHLLAMMEWTEQIISSRDLALSKLDWEVNFYRQSWAGRFLMVCRSGYRVVTRDSRTFLRKRKQRRAARP